MRTPSSEEGSSCFIVPFSRFAHSSVLILAVDYGGLPQIIGCNFVSEANVYVSLRSWLLLPATSSLIPYPAVLKPTSGPGFADTALPPEWLWL